MSSLQISQGTFRLSDTKTLNIEQLCVQAGESWAFVGSNGSGKSALARALSGELTLLSGQRENTFARVTRLSLNSCRSWSAMSGSATTRTCSAPEKKIPDARQRKLSRMRLKTPPAAPALQNSSLSATCLSAALNISLPEKRVRLCCARR